jgi:flagellar protein FliO/FliZ
LADVAAPLAPPEVNLLGSALSMGAALCLILALIFLGYWLIRRFGPTALGRGRGGEAPALLGRLLLGHRQSVAVVRVSGKTLVLGVTEHQVNLLTEVPGNGTFATVLKEQGHAPDRNDPS